MDVIVIFKGRTFLKASYLTDGITLLYYDPVSALKQKRNVVMGLNPLVAANGIEESEIAFKRSTESKGLNRASFFFGSQYIYSFIVEFGKGGEVNQIDRVRYSEVSV